MKKAFAVAALVGALALTGCTSTALHGTTPQDQPATKPTPVAVTNDAVFYGTLDTNPTFVGAESEAKGMVKSFCALADTSGFADAFNTASSLAVDEGMSAYDFGFAVGAGVPVYCPQHTADMVAYQRGN